MDNFKKVIEGCRSCYDISGKSPISDADIKDLIDFAVLNVPSPFNSRSTRVVLLLHENHHVLWYIVKKELEKVVPANVFEQIKTKIENSFETGYGTILFYEDMDVAKETQDKFSPPYSNNIPLWAEHASAMHQFAIWALLQKAGLGASIQHFNPLIDKELSKTWNINPYWKLIAQMPFGAITAEPSPREFSPLENRSIMFD